MGLQYVEGAGGDQYSRCLEGTRKDILAEIIQWAAKDNTKPVFSLVDQAGTGKSTISAHLTRQWEGDYSLICRFFFSKIKGIASGYHFANTLARSMATQIPSLRQFVVNAVRDKNTWEWSMEEQLESLVLMPLSKLKEEREKWLSVVREEIRKKANMEAPQFEDMHDTIIEKSVTKNLQDYMDALSAMKRDGRGEETLNRLETAYLAYLRALEKSLSAPLLIVLDALDECLEDDRSKLFRSFITFLSSFSAESVPFKLFFASRPEKDVMDITDSQVVERTQSSLHLPSTPSNQDDIMIYVESRLHGKLKEDQIPLVAARADGLFIWAFTATKFIIDAPPGMAFDKLMQSNLSKRPLDDLYATILADACNHATENWLPDFTKVVQLICVAREPLDVKTIDELLDLGGESEDSGSVTFVEFLSSVLSGGRDGQPVQALHPTFIEFAAVAMERRKSH